MTMREVFTFGLSDDNYGREQCVYAGVIECDVCKQTKGCIATDGSDNEYDSPAICLDCCKKFIDAVTL